MDGATQRCSTHLFFDPKRYDLARVGRYKFNKKLAIAARIAGQSARPRTSSIPVYRRGAGARGRRSSTRETAEHIQNCRRERGQARSAMTHRRCACIGNNFVATRACVSCACMIPQEVAAMDGNGRTLPERVHVLKAHSSSGRWRTASRSCEALQREHIADLVPKHILRRRHRRFRQLSAGPALRRGRRSTTSTIWATAACAAWASCCRTRSAWVWPAWSASCKERMAIQDPRRGHARRI